MEEVNGVKKATLISVIDLKEIIKTIRKMVKVCSLGKVEMFIKVNILMIKEVGTVRCIGLTDLSIKVNGSMEVKMEKES